MISLLRKITPKPIIQLYHLILSKLAVLLYANPSKKMIVVGITGTNGKSSTVQLTSQLLTLLGDKVGYTTTAGFWIDGEKIENKLKMTMPGRFLLQSLMSKMVRKKCRVAIIETTSQGTVQFRHLGINYDTVVFTNLTPEHIESHGGFENYKKAKGELFRHLTKRRKKKIDSEIILKTSIVNFDDEHSEYFNSFKADRKFGFGWSGEASDYKIVARKSILDFDGLQVSINGVQMKIPFLADFEQKNTLAAISIAYSLGYSLSRIASVVSDLKPIPGRFERIKKGQPFEVIVDYAYEPFAIEALLNAVDQLKPARIIGIHGSAGGGRDVSRREKIGRLAAKREEIVIVTNEDPYDEDPRKIIEAVADGAKAEGKIDGKDLFLIDDRSDAINFAINGAKAGDVVLITGKGNEHGIAVANRKQIPWNDTEAAQSALVRLGYV
ncbi:hypothetical protein CO057_03170 [Candidatus Uhrbacteria bacterium CG_4_9_14_0_2_um_filter_41_50]|uniref:UDP-N-acetylmuramoyl-L-alanyl-D-glutamate--2, 6-diaminopimelate ligase n=1 Tax=Candidatus Uhrbacteria bacterium CG_4_9_14_0_2_um_filter_41_50 TaxID=1975031 RepID=A0A2M8ENI3_9BACT|nr:MAG: hypothetical protein COZ45_03700 [Candidatus Uhrbacteria bacterium CG_4_10_14_3_um_filter_41_21]PIZ54981.1 MAG: hypothetical protein COY24_02060 [Candidatus Uhrbacteria bacterium CG_4_10_14_0_2_um_filter_41_21]PJB84346.1 MAG: hypothetical protein CO086_04060 [Candidatus Uhrbacteria bacterium CG_4_9_14_0_8_um_filter_41_16]PJC24300.1 MAG: hypothetical protein CO057_03170 [Candidatus Uhrbacteria bacterium CG_4_9_14_0_2_um_filter_41_50]PJE75337.1 MAG: hypothetical protein COV03_01035 [Candi